MWGTVFGSSCACRPGRRLDMVPLGTNLWACHIICRQPEVPPTTHTSSLSSIFQSRGFTKVHTIKSKISKACHVEKHVLRLVMNALVCKLFWEGTYFMCHVLYRALILRADALETQVCLLTSNQYLGIMYSHLHSGK